MILYMPVIPSSCHFFNQSLLQNLHFINQTPAFCQTCIWSKFMLRKAIFYTNCHNYDNILQKFKINYLISWNFIKFVQHCKYLPNTERFCLMVEKTDFKFLLNLILIMTILWVFCYLFPFSLCFSASMYPCLSVLFLFLSRCLSLSLSKIYIC